MVSLSASFYARLRPVSALAGNPRAAVQRERGADTRVVEESLCGCVGVAVFYDAEGIGWGCDEEPGLFEAGFELTCALCWFCEVVQHEDVRERSVAQARNERWLEDEQAETLRCDNAEIRRYVW